MLTMIAAILAAATVGHDATGPDPMAAIRQGKLRCGWPDAALKTCRSIARYTALSDDTFDVSVDGLPSEDGLVLHYTSRGRVARNQLCIRITADDIARSTFTKGGVTMIGTALENARNATRADFAPLFGREICDRDDPPGTDGVSASVSFVDGVLAPALDRTVKWVDVRDGYALGPLPGGMI
ncbi:MAG: hypothetical protein E7773_06045 [Sphingomonas sp.]|uniref:hypothetical protein n=1 Tax=Sphingomonas sp. TaxID=28214 RepID=UPI00121138B2|nr:hypothetical protein [Sphingomonas sp.]THD36572.1 MAG: hypothetical protein E7773_06045 [Sphingomonas sp.]